MRIRALLFVASMLLLTACMGGQTRPMRLQEAAHNLNIATRFGRMDIATENVAAKAQTDFAKRHFAWGREVRIVDVDFVGMQLIDGDNAKVLVAVGWQRLDEQDLRITQVVQTWKYGSKGWKLVEEERSGGDVGLFGEPTQVVRPKPRGDVQFPSMTIRGEE